MVDLASDAKDLREVVRTDEYQVKIRDLGYFFNVVQGRFCLDLHPHKTLGIRLRDVFLHVEEAVARIAVSPKQSPIPARFEFNPLHGFLGVIRIANHAELNNTPPAPASRGAIAVA
eukprot:CAMPEP_0167780006 /NCGR_PEP_ID=MMETSP0111_2-20121227/5116_1 /TAXON_ID=91324 /ORGANISM="Lotharella globosa, Strain CCCM811" /LENGTH=115 /DNA_ID=CAMNT_0007670467 /DNA_START=221 /DNA_END=568 /DNA_ORIENTATION=+